MTMLDDLPSPHTPTAELLKTTRHDGYALERLELDLNGVERIRNHLLPLYAKYGRQKDGRIELFDCGHLVYSAPCVVKPGANLCTGRVLFQLAGDPFEGLESYAQTSGRLQGVKLNPVINGWCSWFYTRRMATEEEQLANAQFIAQRLKPYGVEWVQLDAGWQKACHEQGPGVSAGRGDHPPGDRTALPPVGLRADGRNRRPDRQRPDRGRRSTLELVAIRQARHQRCPRRRAALLLQPADPDQRRRSSGDHSDATCIRLGIATRLVIPISTHLKDS